MRFEAHGMSLTVFVDHISDFVIHKRCSRQRVSHEETNPMRARTR